jgi:hypothetical protein
MPSLKIMIIPIMSTCLPPRFSLIEAKDQEYHKISKLASIGIKAR